MEYQKSRTPKGREHEITQSGETQPERSLDQVRPAEIMTAPHMEKEKTIRKIIEKTVIARPIAEAKISQYRENIYFITDYRLVLYFY